MANKSSVAKQFSGLPLKSLIGAPLVAVADANALLSKSQTKFLLETCFERDENNSKAYRPIFINFTLQRNAIGPDGLLQKEPVTMEFSVPLLTLIPINQLAVEKLDVVFEMEVKSAVESHNKAEPQDQSKTIPSNDSTDIHGFVARRSKGDSSDKTTSTARYEIHMEAGQLPLSKGLTSIIDILCKSMMPIQAVK